MSDSVPILAVVGGKEAGKTRVVEALTGALVKRGYKIGTIKHIPHKGFTIDTPEKDTWRHSRAGAKLVISIAPEEITMIRKTGASRNELKEAIKLVHEGEVDLILVEGFRKKFMRNAAVPKIIVVGTRLDESVKKYRGVLAVVGSWHRESLDGIPVLNFEEANKLGDIVEKYFRSGSTKGR